MTKGTVVVALRGPCRNDIGVVTGPDIAKGCGNVLVRFPGNVYPYEFRSMAPKNLRLASAGEQLVREVA